MNDSQPSETDADLDSWVVDFLEAEESGDSLDETACLNVRPELREPVSKFVKFHRQLHELTGPFRQLAKQSREQSWPSLSASDIDARRGGHEHFRADELPRRLGSFELLERIGQGGMGVVYKARQLSLQRIVAVKTTRADVSLSEDELQRFRNEAEFVARLDHPGIVPVYEVGVSERQLFYSMRLLEGGDLGQRLDQYRDDSRAAALLMVAVARAVHHAHQRGVLHRDLKPSNILLDGDGQPLVADFGLARRFSLGSRSRETSSNVNNVNNDRTLTSSATAKTGPATTKAGDTLPESLTKSGLLIGTPGYMAPEQVARSSRVLTTATDVYGLGAVLYALLTGQPPFRGTDTFDTLLLVGAGDPTPPRQLIATVDRDLESICLKCLAREPERRYGSAAEVANDLERWLSGTPVVARPAGMWERFWRRCRRHPAVAALSFLVATLFITLLCGLAASVWLLREEQSETRKQKVAADHEAAKARQRELDTRRLLYVSDINQAARAFESSDLLHMNELLDRHIPKSDETDLRGFEWHHLRHLSRSRDVVESYGQLHAGQIFCVTHSPDGRRLATSSEDRSVVVWDAVSRERLFDLKSFADDANGILFTPDGKTLIASGEDGSIWTCDAATGANPSKRFQTPGRDPIRHIDVNAAGTMLVANCSESYVRRFEFPSMKELPESALETAHPSKPGPVRFSQDGATLITSGRDGTVLIWDSATLRLRHRFQDWSEVRALAVAHHRTWAVATGNDQVVRVFDYQTGQIIHRLTGPSEHVLSVAISPNDDLVAAADRSGGIRVWELTTGRLVNLLPGKRRQVWSVTFTPDSRKILAADSQGEVLGWNRSTSRGSQIIAQDDDVIRQLLWLPRQQSLAWLNHRSGQLTVQEMASGERRDESVGDGENHTIALAGDGERWVVGGPLGTVQLWYRGESRPRWKVQTHPGWIKALAITTDGQTVLLCVDGDRVRLWNATTGEPAGILEIDDQPSVTFTVSSDGKSVAMASYRSLAIINLQTREIRSRIPRVGNTGISALAFSTDGSLLAVACLDRSIEIWPTHGESSPRVMLGHTRDVSSLAFSPDGRTLASASLDGTVRLWNVTLGQELLTLRGAEQNHSLVFSPDGQSLFAGGENLPGRGAVYAWNSQREEQSDSKHLPFLQKQQKQN